MNANRYDDITPVNVETEPVYTEYRINMVESLASMLVETKMAGHVAGDAWFELIQQLHSADLNERRQGAVKLIDECLNNPDALMAAFDRHRYELAGR